MESGKTQAKSKDPKDYPDLDLASVLVTEANNGLGLEFIRQLIQLENSDFIFATIPENSTCEELNKIIEDRKASAKARVVLIKMDVENLDSVRKAVTSVDHVVGKKGLTLLINNGGIAETSDSFPEFTLKSLRHYFAVNTIAPVRVLQEFLPLLQRGTYREPETLSVSRSAVLNISDLGASIQRTGEKNLEDLGAPSSKMSKAALNMAMKITAELIRDQGILVVMMCPGTKEKADQEKPAVMSNKESVENILATLKTLEDVHQGIFMDSKGEQIDF